MWNYLLESPRIYGFSLNVYIGETSPRTGVPQIIQVMDDHFSIETNGFMGYLHLWKPPNGDVCDIYEIKNNCQVFGWKSIIIMKMW